MALKERWLVTGGAGFIGSHIAEDLVRRGRSVRIYDNLSFGNKRNFASIADQVEFVKGDLRDFAAVRRAMKGIQYVSHQGALRAVPGSMADPISYTQVNVDGIQHVLHAAKEAGTRRVVFASSSSAYGDAKVFPQKESFVTAPISPYAASKVAGELYCAVYTKSFGLDAVALRYFNVFGPRQDPASQYAVVIPKFIRQALDGKVLTVDWDGKQSRDFTFIDNVVAANWLASRAPKAPGEVFNVGNGKNASLLDVIEGLETLIGHKLERRHSPKRGGDVRKTWADISKARRLLGYRPPVSFEQGLAKTFHYFKSL